jgi:hypothetical protein
LDGLDVFVIQEEQPMKWPTQFLTRLALTTLLVLAGAAALFGQANTGAFAGTVTDPSGAVIPGATITVTREGTNVAITRTSGPEGLYRIPDLIPAFYTLKAEAKGFKTLVNQHVELNVGATLRVDFKMEVGAVAETITVEGAAPQVDTETGLTLSEVVTAREVENLPLNGRNIFQLIQIAPGAVDVTGLVTEAGARGFTSVVNGARANMNGYMLDGITDKGLSGGANTMPSQDTVQEFRVETEMLSAQYGSTVGATTTIITKSGTNNFHGSAYEFLRNDKLNTREFYERNQLDSNGNEIPGSARNPFRFNQFGATMGGPIIKDKLFFFGSYEGERTRVSNPQLLTVETPEWRQFVQANAPDSVAALLYKDFPGPSIIPGTTTTAADVMASTAGCTTVDAACVSGYPYFLDPNTGLGAALIANGGNIPINGNATAAGKFYSRDQFYNGNQFSAKIDYQTQKHHINGRYQWDQFKDPFYSPSANGGAVSAFVAARGTAFSSPQSQSYPHFTLGWAWNISPTVLNDFRVGVTRGVNDITANNPGVPQIVLDTGEVQFGSYNGYPQIFHETVYQLTDMVTVTRGKHNLKFGAEYRQNYENSEFNVGRPSVEFYDGIAFAAGMVEAIAGGVDPGPIDPATGRSTGSAHYASNIRGWRNKDFGGFIQDDWKVRPGLTFNIGLRYDLYTRHTDKYLQNTEFILPDGTDPLNRMQKVNCYVNQAGAVGFDGLPCVGGFQGTTNKLTTGDHNNFSPRVGFAWDMFGDGKTALRGGFGVSYNGEIYNPLSNSRWDPPYYSFNLAFCSDGNAIGAGLSDACPFGPQDGSLPTYTGPPTNPGAGPAGATAGAFAGNIIAWNGWNANSAFLTGIVLPGFRDPYVYGSHLSVEHEFKGGFALKVAWVGTFGHKLYRAEDINRSFGLRDNPPGGGGVGPTTTGVCSLFGPYRANCLFGRMRVWENSVNSNYNGLQVVLDKKLSHGFEWHANYVWSHSLDTRSTWHSGATTSNGASEGFSMDLAHPELDYGNSVFDMRHHFSNSFVWMLPWYSDQKGFAGKVLGGWQVNNIITWRSGFHWTPYCSSSSFPGGSTACDFNRDGVRNDRPNVPAFGQSISGDRTMFEPDHTTNLQISDFMNCTTSPRPSCGAAWTGAYNGNLGRNTFLGPTFADVDLSFFKNFSIKEDVKLQFRAEAFNLFNRTNLGMPTANFNGTGSENFGISTSTSWPRQIQFALRLTW